MTLRDAIGEAIDVIAFHVAMAISQLWQSLKDWWNDGLSHRPWRQMYLVGLDQ